MKLIFKEITFKNLFSYGNQPTTIKYNEVASTIVIAPNGTGKTAALIDSLFFAIFGEAFRDVKKGQIINCINQKDGLVNLNFDLDDKPYTINRGLKPDIFTVFHGDQELWSDLRASDKQSQLLDLLKIDKTVLKNLVLISEENVPFMRLDGPSRRAFVERVLNLLIFADVHNKVKLKLKELKDPFARLKANMDGKQEVISRLERIIANSDSPDQKFIEESEARIKLLDAFLDKAAPALDKFTADSLKYSSTMQGLNTEFAMANSAIRAAEDSIAKFKEGTCPTCGGDIHSDKIECFNTALSEAQAAKADVMKRTDEISELLKPLREKIEKGKSKIDEAKTEKWSLETKIEKEKAKQIANVDEELTEAQNELATLLDEYADMKSDVEDYQELDKVLKTGNAKLPIISEYIPFFNRKINDYLELFGMQIFFELDSEFNETIRARYKDAFTYESFSTGQRQRIDFAILMTWRDVASKLASLETNLLIVDEFASKLDDDGFNVVSKALSSLDGNVFCIAPTEKPKQEDFDRKFKIGMNAGFSILTEVER